jgi:hypothetical protein
MWFMGAAINPVGEFHFLSCQARLSRRAGDADRDERRNRIAALD